jgi:hypothetical protein
MMQLRALAVATAVALLASVGALAGDAGAAPDRPSDPVAYWTSARRAAAVPRDLRIDHRGLGYLRAPDGTLTPYGHTEPPVLREVTDRSTATPQAATPQATDTTGPSVTIRSPASGATITTSTITLSATVSDPSGVRSVSFGIRYPDGRNGSFAGRTAGNGVWSVTLNGFTNGSWSWTVTARDNAGKGGNTTTAPSWPFTVAISSTPPPTGDVIASQAYTAAGDPVRKATGRLFFSMPASKSLTRWVDYVCSGSVVTDSATDVSLILTAAHCIYDDADKAFARNVLFIPDQASTTAAGSDRTCTNDPYGCWAPRAAVVDVNYTTRTFPANNAWDYGFYVVAKTGAHSGTTTASDSLEAVTGTLPVSFGAPSIGAATSAFGYSYSEDPKLMFCREGLAETGTINWWLGSCGLSGGASGGPWLQPFASGTGTVVSVNSWGYTNSPGMAGPKLSGTSAACVYDKAAAAPTTNVAATC